MERPTGCPVHGLEFIERDLNDYRCMYEDDNGLCFYKLNKVEFANYTQIQSEIEFGKTNKPVMEKEKSQIVINGNGNILSIDELKKGIEQKAWNVIDEYFDYKDKDPNRAKIAIAALAVIIKSRQ